MVGEHFTRSDSLRGFASVIITAQCVIAEAESGGQNPDPVVRLDDDPNADPVN